MESIGFLEVAVRTAGGALPVGNALVSIYGNEEGKENGLIYSLVTNEAGTTPRVALAAPPVILSQSPENENTYGAYNVYVTKEGFYNSEHIGVPVFQGITAVQRVDLLPLMEYSSPTDDIPHSTIRSTAVPRK